MSDETQSKKAPDDESPRDFGTGWISGTLSVTLGAIGLFAVLCFHFPSLLTLPQVREYYPLLWVRGLLHVVLVSAFLLGLTSVMLRHNKILGLLGMGLVLIAALLGGSRVEIEGELKSDYYLGMDYVLLNLIVFSLIFIPLEKLFGRLDQGVFRKGWHVDLAYFFVMTMLVQITTYLTLRPAFVLFSWAVNPDVQAFVRSQPYIVQLLEIMFLADFVQYWVHRAFHEISYLWKFHAVHHSTEVLDWMSGNRIHFVDLAVTRSLIYIPSYILGFSELPIYIYIVFVAVHSVFIHSNLDVPFGPFSIVFAGPQFHHWHHGSEPEAIDKNYAIHFPIIDWVFGTYYMPDRWPAYYGVHHNDVPENYFAQWVYPFIPATTAVEKKPAEAVASDETKS